MCRVMLHRGQEKRPDDRAETVPSPPTNVIWGNRLERWAGARDEFGIAQVKRLLILSALPVLMGACGLAVDRDARAYNTCLARHPQDAVVCEGRRQARAGASSSKPITLTLDPNG